MQWMNLHRKKKTNLTFNYFWPGLPCSAAKPGWMHYRPDCKTLMCFTTFPRLSEAAWICQLMHLIRDNQDILKYQFNLKAITQFWSFITVLLLTMWFFDISWATQCQEKAIKPLMSCVRAVGWKMYSLHSHHGFLPALFSNTAVVPECLWP